MSVLGDGDPETKRWEQLLFYLDSIAVDCSSLCGSVRAGVGLT